MSTQITLPEADLKETIQAYYGSRIDNGSCCSPAQDGSTQCCDDSALYTPDELTHIPEDAADNSFGCGNPTALAALQPGEVVLDLGSGGGIDVFLAARKVGPTGFVYGVDMTPKMLDLARRNLAKMGVSNVEFRQGDIEAIPVADASVDVLISNCVINLSPDKPQVLREAFRVLKPGGRIAFSDIVVDGDLTDLPVSEAQIRAGLSWAGCIAGALTVDQFRTYLADAGFADISVDVRHRYSTDEFRPYADGPDSIPGILAEMDPAVLDSLARRFTSSEITARKE
jgi:ubiquinone/menaquinone biosynthesis C-methylase UbiE